MSSTEFKALLYWIPYFSILLLMTLFLSLKSQTFVISQNISLYSHANNLPLILNNLEHDMRNLPYLFKINLLKANPGKFSFVILWKKNRLKYSLKVESITIKESGEVELLGITIDKALKYFLLIKHIKSLCHIAQYKLYALKRIRKYLTLDKSKLSIAS